jgi:hypothetical protein
VASTSDETPFVAEGRSMRPASERMLKRFPIRAIGVAVCIAASPTMPAEELAPDQGHAPTREEAPPQVREQEPGPKQEAALKQEPLLRRMLTGSNVMRVTDGRSLPLVILDRAYIDQSGATSAAELIRTLPQVQSFGPAAATPPGTR